MSNFLKKVGLGFLKEAGLGALDTGFGMLLSGQKFRRQKELQEREFEFNEQAAANAYSRQLDFWRRNNEYNSFRNQRALMEQAGLNPALMYSDGTSGALAGGVSVPEGRGASQGAAPDAPLSHFLQASLLAAQIRNIDADTNRIIGDTKDPQETKNTQLLNNRLLELNVLNQQTVNDLNSLDLRFKTEVYDTEVEIREQTAANMKKQYEEASQRILDSIKGRELTDAQIDEAFSRILLNEANAAYAQVRADWHGKHTQADIERLNALRDELVSQKGLNNQKYQIDKYRQDLRLVVRADSYGVGIGSWVDKVRFWMSAVFGREFQ